MINTIFWVVALIAFVVIEASTSVLVSIWFACGALAAIVATALGAGTITQIIVFVVVSAVCVFALRKYALKNIKSVDAKTNLDRIIGQDVIITQTVDNAKRTGTAVINDVEWKVTSEDSQIINEGEHALVTHIDGVKLVVKK